LSEKGCASHVGPEVLWHNRGPAKGATAIGRLIHHAVTTPNDRVYVNLVDLSSSMIRDRPCPSPFGSKIRFRSTAIRRDPIRWRVSIWVKSSSQNGSSSSRCTHCMSISIVVEDLDKSNLSVQIAPRQRDNPPGPTRCRILFKDDDHRRYPYSHPSPEPNLFKSQNSKPLHSLRHLVPPSHPLRL
jgi:hypothetical protein